MNLRIYIISLIAIGISGCAVDLSNQSLKASKPIIRGSNVDSGETGLRKLRLQQSQPAIPDTAPDSEENQVAIDSVTGSADTNQLLTTRDADNALFTDTVDAAQRLPQSPPDTRDLLTPHNEPSSPAKTIPSPTQLAPTSTSTLTSTNRHWSGVTRSQLRDQALQNHPALSAARADYRSLEGKFQQTGLSPNPTAGVIADDINEDGGAGRYGVFFGRRILRGDKIGASQDVVSGELQSAACRLQEIQQRLLTDVDRFYYDVLIAQEQLALADQLIQISRRVVTLSQSLYSAQEVPQTSVLQATLQLKKSEVTARRFRAAQLSAKRKLAAIIGQDSLPTPHVAGNVNDFAEIKNFESAYDQLLNQSPELARLVADIETRKRQLIRDQREPISDVTWQTSLQYDFVSDDVIGGFQVGWKIPTANRNEGAIYQSSQQVVAAEHRVETKTLQLRRRLAEAYEGYLDAKLQVQAFQNEILPIAEETNQLLTKGYQAGETEVLELLVSQRVMFQTRLSYLQNLRILWRQTASIQGLLLDGGLDPKN